MPYKIIDQLGRGSFGIVERVEDDEGRIWARKTFAVPAIAGVNPLELRSRFEREVKYQSQIDSPNVVKIHKADLSADPPWFLMDVAQCSLADVLR